MEDCISFEDVAQELFLRGLLRFIDVVCCLTYGKISKMYFNLTVHTIAPVPSLPIAHTHLKHKAL